MKQYVTELLEKALARAHAGGQLKSGTAGFSVDAPKDPSHGDFATNAAMVLARAEGKPPRAIAEIIKSNLEPGSDIAEVTIAGPGFINFRMAPQFWHAELRRAALEGERYWLPECGGGKTVDVEFLSANPTGPLTVGHGRNAVIGDTIARLHQATGYRVTREYYFNNGGRQMRLLGESVRARYFEQCGRTASLPEDGYQGEYIREIARGLFERHGDKLLDIKELEPFRAAAEDAIFTDIRATCARLKIDFDVYTNELDFLRGGQIEAVLGGLRREGLLAEYDGAVWLKGERLGLPKD